MMARERSGLLLHGLVDLGHTVAAGVALACKMMVGCEGMAPKNISHFRSINGNIKTNSIH